MVKKSLLLLIILLSIPITYSTVCIPSTINYQTGHALNQTIICTGSDVNRTINVAVIGQYFTTNTNVIGSQEQKSILVSFQPPTQAGTYNGQIFFDDIYSVPVTMTVIEEEEEIITGCRLIELPHTTNFRIKQGDKGISNQVRIKVSTECPTLSMSVTEETQMSKPMYLQGQSGDVEPGETFSFSIGLDAEGVSTGTYTNKYTVSGSFANEIHKKNIYLSTIITVGTSPITNQTFYSMPTCSVDSDILINNSYHLICMNENPNINIEVPHSEFFEGISVSESEGRFEYKFKPVKIGNVKFIVLFKYKGVSIGTPFSKDVRITSSPTQLLGNTMFLQYYPKISNFIPGESLSILVKDKKTNTTLDGVNLYLDGVKLTVNTITPEQGKQYTLTASVAGFPSVEETFTIQSQPITITASNLNPAIDEIIIINTVPQNATLLLDGILHGSNQFVFTTASTHVITAQKENYKDSNLTITVKKKVITMTDIPSSLKMNTPVYIDLNAEAQWEVYWKKDNDSIQELYLDENNNPYSKLSNQISFIPMEKGIYTVYLEGKKIASYNNTGWFKWSWWYLLPVIIFALLFANSKGWFKGKRSGIGYGGYSSDRPEEVTEVIK